MLACNGEKSRALTLGVCMAAIILFGSGCATLQRVFLQSADLTSAAAPYAPPLNAQDFSIRVTPPAGIETRGVILSVAGERVLLNRVSGNVWRGSWPAPRCAERIDYSYTAIFDQPVDGAPETAALTGLDEASPPTGASFGLLEAASAPMAVMQRFPTEGEFSLQITDRPRGCNAGDEIPVDSGGRLFSVNVTADRPDAAPGDGVCSINEVVDPSGPPQCSLRAAVMEANASPGPDEIVLQGNGRYRLDRTGGDEDVGYDASIGDLDILDDVEIRTEDPAACVENISAVFPQLVRAESDPESALTRAAFPGGQMPWIDAEPLGDRVFDVAATNPDGGAVRLQLRCVQVSGGAIEAAPVFGDNAGGGIRNRGTLVTSRVIVSGNTATGQADGLGLANFGEAWLRQTAVIGNRSDAGGVVAGGGDGGGIYNGADASLFVRQSLIALNAAARGPGIYQARRGADYRDCKCETLLRNTTVYGNDGVGAGADGSLAADVSNYGAMLITWSTLDNPKGNVLRTTRDGATVIYSSILGADFRDLCVSSGQMAGVRSLGFNYLADDSCGSFNVTDRIGDEVFAGGDSLRDPLVPAGLQQEGGFTPVRPLRAPDEVFNNLPFVPPWEVKNDPSPLLTCQRTDQRRFLRPAFAIMPDDAESPFGGLCDSGAFELNANSRPAPPTNTRCVECIEDGDFWICNDCDIGSSSEKK